MIYIQSDTDRKRPHHFDVASAMFGAIETDQNYKLVSFDDVKSDKLNMLIKQNLFIGSVEFMKEVFSKIGKSNIKVPKNSNREHKIMTLNEAKLITKPIFLKPLDIKLFTGFFMDEITNTSISNIPDSTLVMVYDVFETPIKSEFRCYIHRNKVVDIRNYSGDLFCSPNEDYLNSVIEENRLSFPISYTIDIGVLENEENVVIEYNDMWAIGNYGMPNDLYLRLLRDRYFEIVR
jgi:hypothetical protein